MTKTGRPGFARPGNPLYYYSRTVIMETFSVCLIQYDPACFYFVNFEINCSFRAVLGVALDQFGSFTSNGIENRPNGGLALDLCSLGVSKTCVGHNSPF